MRTDDVTTRLAPRRLGGMTEDDGVIDLAAFRAARELDDARIIGTVMENVAAGFDNGLAMLDPDEHADTYPLFEAASALIRDALATRDPRRVRRTLHAIELMMLGFVSKRNGSEP